jgi:hypothetical protein
MAAGGSDEARRVWRAPRRRPTGELAAPGAHGELGGGGSGLVAAPGARVRHHVPTTTATRGGGWARRGRRRHPAGWSGVVSSPGWRRST